MESVNILKIDTKCAILDSKYYIIKSIGVGACGKVKLAKKIQN
jgi:carbon catabolite-derepressing protein kinase